MEYMIITNVTISMMEHEITKLIGDGWQPQGGVSTVQGEDNRQVWITQAMVRTARPKPVKVSNQSISANQVVNEYNKYFKGKNVTIKRKLSKSLVTRINICIRDEFQTMKEWRSYFELITMSDWLMGKIPPTNGYKQFKLTLEYIVNDTNISKIIERRV